MMSNMSINNAELIAFVKERPFMYDSRRKTGQDKLAKIEAYEEIANRFGVTAKDAQTRWKSLRDRYKKEITKYIRSSNLDVDEAPEIKWKLFNSLNFLRHHLHHRESTGNITTMINLEDVLKSKENCNMKTNLDDLVEISLEPANCNGAIYEEKNDDTDSDDLCKTNKCSDPTPSYKTIKPISKFKMKNRTILQKKKLQRLSEDDLAETITTTCNNLTNTLQKLAESSCSSPTTDMYGRIIGEKLKQLDPDKSFNLFLEICGLIQQELQKK